MNPPAPSPWLVWWRALRPRTLPAAVAPVLVGSAFAYRVDDFWPVTAALCLIFAVLVQIGTNFANDYFDFVKGADTAERVGPARAVASGWVTPGAMKAAMLVTFAFAFLFGLLLWPSGGWPLVVIGVASILAGIAYTGGPYPLGYHGWGDVFVFLFFGLVAVSTTYYVQAGDVDIDIVLAGAAIGLLAANILVMNNYRDAETDARAGKRTLVVRFGRGFARAQYWASLGFAFALPLWFFFDDYPWSIFLPWLALPWGIDIGRRLHGATQPEELIRLLGDAGLLLVLYAVLLAVGVATSPF